MILAGEGHCYAWHDRVLHDLLAQRRDLVASFFNAVLTWSGMRSQVTTLMPTPGIAVRAQVRNPALHDLAVRVPCLNCALVHPTLEVLLPLLVRKQAVQHGPQAALRRQVGDLRNGQPRERRRRVRREVREEVEQAHVVRADVDVHDGD